MALLSAIRRRHFRDQLSIPEISWRAGLPWNTVRKSLGTWVLRKWTPVVLCLIGPNIGRAMCSSLLYKSAGEYPVSIKELCEFNGLNGAAGEI